LRNGMGATHRAKTGNTLQALRAALAYRSSPVDPHREICLQGFKMNRRGFLASLLGLAAAPIAGLLPVKAPQIVLENGFATVLRRTSTEWIISGTRLT